MTPEGSHPEQRLPENYGPVTAGQVRETRGGRLFIDRDLGDGWWQIHWDPPARPGDPPLTDRMHEEKIITSYPLLEAARR